ncbi:hypothetical protein BC567DRAFT_224869 [Phyllosticta citribraziliensis]
MRRTRCLGILDRHEALYILRHFHTRSPHISMLWSISTPTSAHLVVSNKCRRAKGKLSERI